MLALSHGWTAAPTGPEVSVKIQVEASATVMRLPFSCAMVI